MNIIVCGAGAIGGHAAEVLAANGGNVTVVADDVAALEALSDSLDIATVGGQPAAAEVLAAAGAAKADVVIAATDVDEVNLLCASTASYLGADRTFATVTHSTYLQRSKLDYSQIFSIDALVCPALSTAQAIASHLRNPAAMKVERLAGSQIEVHQFEASAGAPGIDRHLSEVELPDGALLAAITRGDKTTLPTGSSAVVEGDQVLLVANTDVFHDARRLLRNQDAGRRSVVIMGGSPIAVWLCRALRSKGFSIRLFETDRERAEELAEKLEWVTVIQADPTESGVFTDEHIEQADAFVALKGDEQNILSCAWASGLGVQETYPVVTRDDYAPFVKAMGITLSFSPRHLAVREIQQRLNRAPLTRLAAVAGEDLCIFRVRVGKDAQVLGQALSDLPLMPDCMIVVQEADDHGGVVPRADAILSAGDVVHVVANGDFESDLRRLFAVG